MKIVTVLGLAALLVVLFTGGVGAAPSGVAGGAGAGAGGGTGGGAAKGAADKPTTGKDEILPDYTEVKLTALRARLADYNGKKITFVSTLYHYDTEVGYLAEATGYKSGRDFRLYFAAYYSGRSSYGYSSDELAVLAKRDKKFVDMLSVLDDGATTRVYGRVRRFRTPPDSDTVVRYFVELELIKPVEADVKPGDAPAPAGGGKPVGGKPAGGGPPVGGRTINTDN